MTKTPTLGTLRRYGLTASEWLKLVPPDGLCPICKRPPRLGRWVTDHEHVPKWRKLPPHERKRYVRMVCCNYCNYRLLRKGMTLERARRIVAALELYQQRKERET